MLSERPFVLGSSPSIADFGLMGPMLRHFGQDPTPAAIMRAEAPRVFDWVSRVWNAAEHATQPSFVTEIDASANPMLQEICETHLVQLAENAKAWAAGNERFEMRVQGCHYRNLPVSRYRVYCLERLREAFQALSAPGRESVKALLPYRKAEVVWESEVPAASAYDEARQAPFNKAINVFQAENN